MENKKYKVIIDTDPGVDDAACLAYAFFDENIEIKLLTSVVGNTSLAKTTRKRSSKYGDLILPIVLNSIEQSLDEDGAPCINASILNFFCEWGLVNADFVREKYKTYNLTKDEFKAFSDITYEFLDVVYDKIRNEVFERALNNLIKKGFKIHKHKWLIKKVDEPQARLSSTKEDIQIETLSKQIMKELEIENRNLRLAGNKRTEYDNLFKKVLYEKMSITSHAHRVSTFVGCCNMHSSF